MSEAYPSTKLGDVAKFIRGITFKPNDVVPVETSESALCMRTKNVQAELDLTDVWAVHKRFVKRDEQYLLSGDILISSANSWNLVGKCCWIPRLEPLATFGGFVSVLRAHRAQINERYLYYWFSSDKIQTTVRSFGRQTTNISNLDFARCLELDVPTPPLETQVRIVQLLDQVELQRTRHREAVRLLGGLSASLLDRAFRGQLWDPASR